MEQFIAEKHKVLIPVTEHNIHVLYNPKCLPITGFTKDGIVVTKDNEDVFITYGEIQEEYFICSEDPYGSEDDNNSAFQTYCEYRDKALKM